MIATTLTDCRMLKDLLGDDWRAYAEAIAEGETDITCPDGSSEHRMILAAEIDTVMKEELLADEYILGCCSAWFIADITDLDFDTIEKAQKNDEMTILGALMAHHIDEAQEQMVNHDGYGHHFNHWDGSEDEIEIDGHLWHVFVIN